MASRPSGASETNLECTSTRWTERAAEALKQLARDLWILIVEALEHLPGWRFVPRPLQRAVALCLWMGVADIALALAGIAILIAIWPLVDGDGRRC